MDYQGNQFNAAQAGATDDVIANGQVVIDVPTCNTRTIIYNAIMAGQVQEATSLLTLHHPLVIERDPELCFRLMRMHFIQLVRENRLQEAVTFAQTHMASLIKYRPSLLDEFEMTMQIMVFGNLVTSKHSEYFHPLYRMDVAIKINNLIIKMESEVDDLSAAIGNMNIIKS